MASITERAQRMEKDLREANAKHDRVAAELQVCVYMRAWTCVDTRVRRARVGIYVYRYKSLSRRVGEKKNRVNYE